MKSKNTIVLIGGIHLGHKPSCGETMKNQLFLRRFQELFENVYTVDTYHWQKHPWRLLKLLVLLLTRKRAKFIISASGSSRYLINFIYKMQLRRDVYFWVVGGNLPNAVEKGKYCVDALNYLKHLLVQGRSMVSDLQKLGITNAVYVPNSKPVNYQPVIQHHFSGKPFRFVFLSRIHPDKGINEIFSATDILGEKGYEEQFSVDFYGTIADEYKDEFLNEISVRGNCSYYGYLDLTSDAGYELLSSYDVMLFPTYWEGEGFPGVVLDAYISGVPLIATNWNLNAEVVEDHITGLLIPVQNSNSVAMAMKAVIDGDVDLMTMKKECVNLAREFDYRNVLSDTLMKQLHFAD